MEIANDWEFNDLVTGLKFKVIRGKVLDRLHIENIQQGSCNNRDLWFTKKGEFDGTGSSVSESKCQENFVPDDIDPKEEAMMADSPDRFHE